MASSSPVNPTAMTIAGVLLLALMTGRFDDYTIEIIIAIVLVARYGDRLFGEPDSKT